MGLITSRFGDSKLKFDAESEEKVEGIVVQTARGPEVFD